MTRHREMEINNFTGILDITVGTAFSTNTMTTMTVSGGQPFSNFVIMSGPVTSNVTPGILTYASQPMTSNINYIGNEPAVGATTASVYRIGALVSAGYSPREIRQDFPTLSAEQIKAAGQYVQQNPNPKTNYPTVIFDQVLRNSGLYKVLK